MLDNESLQTVMCEAESIINGRPLTAISDDPKDLEPLTPNHLLLLRQEASLPPGVFERSQLYSRRRWLQVQYLANVFWYRWKREYLPLLQERQKWLCPRRNFSSETPLLLRMNSRLGIYGRLVESVRFTLTAVVSFDVSRS